MTEYISREAALNFEAEIDADPDAIQASSRGMALYAEHIKALPAADVVPVVRCRVCRYYHQFIERPDGICYNANINTLPFTDDFCKWGAPRAKEKWEAEA